MNTPYLILHLVLLQIAVLVSTSHVSKSQKSDILRRVVNTKKKDLIPIDNAVDHIKIPIDSAVEDIRESTDFAGRERKVKMIMAGEMYAEHMPHLAKRKDIKKLTGHKKTEIPHYEYKNTYKPEIVIGEKKTVIGRHISKEETLPEAFGSEEYDDTNTDDSDTEPDTTDESNEVSGTSADDATVSKSDEESEPEKEPVTTTKGETRGDKLRCRRKCAVPMTYHECAHPRCSQKVGAIKDLCYFLCKHQKERCEDICD